MIYDECVAALGDPEEVNREIRMQTDPMYRAMRLIERIYDKIVCLMLGIAL